jgi:N-acetylglucosamine kinase-like BadF-type ATPase
VSTFLGVDGGGSKTEFLLIDAAGQVLAAHRAGSAYYLETGIDALEAMLVNGIRATLQQAALRADEVGFSFIGLPAHGEDSALQPRLDAIATTLLPSLRHRCGNDMICGWAGALAGRDGINLVAGTGSIAYGEFAGRRARTGGWGELFSDEGSAYWIARRGMNLFSRMSDGRTARGPLYTLIRERFKLRNDLDLCAAIYGPPALPRSEIARLAPLVARAASAGDVQAQQVMAAAARELAGLVHALQEALRPPPYAPVPVSYSGGLFQLGEVILSPLRAALRGGGREYEFAAPVMLPAAGAALYAAKLCNSPLSATAIANLSRQCAAAGNSEVST